MLPSVIIKGLNFTQKNLDRLAAALIVGLFAAGCSIKPEFFGNTELTADLLQYREPGATEWYAYTADQMLPSYPEYRELVVQSDPSRGVGNKSANSMGGGEAPIPPGEVFRVFLFMGQSNMVGHGKASKLLPPVNQPNPRIRIWSRGKWQYLVPQRSFGPEISFAHNMIRFFPGDTIGIIKIAVSGTGIGAWKPDWEWSAASKTGDALKGSLYRDLIVSVREARRVSDFEISGLIWKQGGRDGRRAELAETYQERFVEMVTHLRQDLAAPSLPVFVLTYFDEADLEKNLEEIERFRPKALPLYLSKARVSKYLDNAFPVFHGRLPTRVDQIHFNSEGQLRLGELTAEAVQNYYRTVEKFPREPYTGPIVEPPLH